MSLPDNEAMHVLSPSVFAHHLTSLGRTVFQDNRIEAICPEKPVPTASPTKLSPSVCTPHTVFRHIRRDNLSWKPVRPAMCFLTILLPPNGALPKLFPTVSLPSPNYFPRFPVRPPFHRVRVAPSPRSSPQAISHGFPSVHPVVIPVSLLPTGALPKLFPTVSQAIYTVSSSSSMLSRSLPAKLPPSYFHGFLSVQHCLAPSEAFRKLFARFPLRPACCLVPSPSYLHGFLSVQHAVSLPPSEALPKLFARFPVRPACCLAPSQRSSPRAISTVSCPSSMLSRSLPAKLSASYLHGFQSVQHCLAPSEAFRKLFARFPLRPACCLVPSPSYLHGFLSVQHAVSLPPSEALPKLFARFPVRPACCLAPSQRSFPQAICTVSSPSSMLSHSLPAKLSTSYFHRFQSVQHAVSLPPSEALRKLFARFPLRPACCLAPSQRSSPQAICTDSSVGCLTL